MIVSALALNKLVIGSFHRIQAKERARGPCHGVMNGAPGRADGLSHLIGSD